VRVDAFRSGKARFSSTLCKLAHNGVRRLVSCRGSIAVGRDTRQGTRKRGCVIFQFHGYGLAQVPIGHREGTANRVSARLVKQRLRKRTEEYAAIAAATLRARTGPRTPSPLRPGKSGSLVVRRCA